MGARSGVIQPRGLDSSGTGRSAMPTLGRATIPATEGVSLVSPANDPARALARPTRTGHLAGPPDCGHEGAGDWATVLVLVVRSLGAISFDAGALLCDSSTTGSG